MHMHRQEALVMNRMHPNARLPRRRRLNCGGLILGLTGAAVVASSVASAQVARPMGQRGVGSGEPMIYKTEPNKAGMIKFEKPEDDLGVVPDTKKISYEVTFTNVSDEVLTVERTEGGCGCMVAELAKKVYLPGETGTLELTFDPTGREGPQVKPVRIYYAGSQEPATFTLRSNVEPTIRRPRGVNLQEIVYGQGGEGQFVLTTARKNFEIEKIEVLNPGMGVMGSGFEGLAISADVRSVEPFQISEGEMGTRVVIGLEVHKDVPLGNLFRQVKVTASMDSEDGSERETREVETAVNISIVGDIRTIPSRIQWRRALAGTPVSQQVRLDSRTGQAFEITDMEWLNDQGTLNFTPSLTHEVVTQPNGEPVHVVNITGTFPSDPGTIRGTLIVFTNQTDNPEVVIPVFGAVQNRNIGAGMRGGPAGTGG